MPTTTKRKMVAYDSPLTCEELLEMDESDRAYMAMFAVVLRNYSGCTSPAEEMIKGLIMTHVEAMSLTPEYMEEEVKDFRQSFDMAVRSSRTMARQYPALVLGEECGNLAQQIASLTEGESDLQQSAMTLETAREGIRKYPALVMEDAMREPFASALTLEEED